MQIYRKMRNIEKIFEVLPNSSTEEMRRLLSSRSADGAEVSEIRLRAYGKSSFLLSGERICLSSPTSGEELSRTLTLLCEGALYSKRDSIRGGYVSFADGVRVGICGEARYDGGELVGVSNISSLNFRIPTSVRADTDELFSAWEQTSRGLLIYSPPGVGKTTALRNLVSRISLGRSGLQVAVIDERGEFCPEVCARGSVDILRGYRRAEGMEIALRTLSPEVIAVDEIGRRAEAEAMLESLCSGVRIIATAHAGSLAELRSRISLRPFFENGIFDSALGISLAGVARKMKFERLDE